MWLRSPPAALALAEPLVSWLTARGDRCIRTSSETSEKQAAQAPRFTTCVCEAQGATACHRLRGVRQVPPSCRCPPLEYSTPPASGLLCKVLVTPPCSSRLYSSSACTAPGRLQAHPLGQRSHHSVHALETPAPSPCRCHLQGRPILLSLQSNPTAGLPCNEIWAQPQ